MADTGKTDARYDYMLLIPTLLLIVLGLVIVYSSSSNLSVHEGLSPYFYFERQFLYCVLGVLALVTAKNIPCTVYARIVYPMLCMSMILLLLLFVPGIGHRAGGATRWLRIGAFSFQPSELAKFTLAVYMAYSMAKKGPDMRYASKGLCPHLIVVGIFIGLIALQPDFGTCVILGAWLFILLFVGGVRISYLFLLLMSVVPLMWWAVMNADYRLKRWLAFIDPWKDPRGIGYHIIHSFLAFGSGGWFGAGLGNGKQKLFFLPEPHTDFILSVAGEELGFIGVTVIILLFGIIIIKGIKVALDARDIYSTYLSLGLTTIFGLQVIINMGVVMGLLPTKGLTLPLISYGGTSLVLNMFCIGVLLNVSSRS